MKSTLLGKKAHSKLPLSYYYLTEFLPTNKEVKKISIQKDVYESRISILNPFYKPISIDFPSY